MGWASGDEVFDPVAEQVIGLVNRKRMDTKDATVLLALLINGLQRRGWDTEGESLGEFKDYPFIVAAFDQCDVTLEPDE